MGNRLTQLWRVVYGISRKKRRSRQAVLWVVETKWAISAVADAKSLAGRAALVAGVAVPLEDLAIVGAEVEEGGNRLVVPDIRRLTPADARQVRRDRVGNDRRIKRERRRARFDIVTI